MQCSRGRKEPVLPLNHVRYRPSDWGQACIQRRCPGPGAAAVLDPCLAMKTLGITTEPFPPHPLPPGPPHLLCLLLAFSRTRARGKCCIRNLFGRQGGSHLNKCSATQQCTKYQLRDSRQHVILSAGAMTEDAGTSPLQACHVDSSSSHKVARCVPNDVVTSFNDSKNRLS